MTDDRTIPEIETVSGTGITIRGDDIDTDQILPSRFMKVVTFDGLGQAAFFDKRFDDDDTPIDHPMNEDRFQSATVMVVNANFGCGSSREHAPQSLMRWGIDAIVGESFGEIFAGNCLALGIPTATAEPETIERLQSWIETNPDDEIVVDVAAETVRYGEVSKPIDVTDVQYDALVEGTWDVTELLLSNAAAIERTTEQLPYLGRTDSERPAGD